MRGPAEPRCPALWLLSTHALSVQPAEVNLPSRVTGHGLVFLGSLSECPYVAATCEPQPLVCSWLLLAGDPSL